MCKISLQPFKIKWHFIMLTIFLTQIKFLYVFGDKTFLELLSQVENPKKLLLDFTSVSENDWQFRNPVLSQSFYFIKQEYKWPNESLRRTSPTNTFEGFLYEFQDVLPNYCFFLIDAAQSSLHVSALPTEEVEKLIKIENLAKNSTFTVVFSLSSLSLNVLGQKETLLRVEELFFKFKQKWKNVQIGLYSNNKDFTHPALNDLDVYIFDNSPALISIEDLTLSYSQFNFQMNKTLSRIEQTLGSLNPDCKIFVRYSLSGAFDPSIIFASAKEEKSKLYYLLLKSAVIWINSGKRTGVMLDGFTESAGSQNWFENSTLQSYIEPLSILYEERYFAVNPCMVKGYHSILSSTFKKVFKRNLMVITSIWGKDTSLCILKAHDKSSTNCKLDFEKNFCKRPSIDINLTPKAITDDPNKNNFPFTFYGFPGNDEDTFFGMPQPGLAQVQKELNQTSNSQILCPISSPSSNVTNSDHDDLYDYFCNFYRKQIKFMQLHKSIHLRLPEDFNLLDDDNLNDLFQQLVGCLKTRRLYPGMEILFKIDLDFTNYVPPESKLYCDLEEQIFNEYAEIITNFARTFNFHMAMKFGIGWRKSWWHELVAVDELNELTKVNPFGVARNYPRRQLLKGIHPDPCINYTSELSEDGIPIGMYSGVVFYFEKENKTSEEIQTMLKFLFHKFSLIELYPISNSDLSGLIHELSMFFNHAETTRNGGKVQDLHLRIDCEVINFEIDAYILQNLNKANISSVHLANWENAKLDFIDVANFVKNQNIKMGLSLEDCVAHALSQFQNIANLPPEFFPNFVNYILCNVKQNETKSSTNLFKVDMEEYLDSHLYIEKYFRQWFPDLHEVEIMFRLEHEPIFKEDEELWNVTAKHFLRFLAGVNQYAIANQFKIFMTPAFDSKNKEKYGWWEITDFNNLYNYSAYVEKESEFLGKELWRPQTQEVLSLSSLLTGSFAITISLLIAFLVI